MTGFDTFSFSSVESQPEPENRIYFLNASLPGIQFLMYANWRQLVKAYGLRGAARQAEWQIAQGLRTKPWQHTKPKLGRRV